MFFLACFSRATGRSIALLEAQSAWCRVDVRLSALAPRFPPPLPSPLCEQEIGPGTNSCTFLLHPSEGNATLGFRAESSPLSALRPLPSPPLSPRTLSPVVPVDVVRIRVPDDSEFSSGVVDLIRRCLAASSIYRPSASEARCPPPPPYFCSQCSYLFWWISSQWQLVNKKSSTSGVGTSLQY